MKKYIAAALLAVVVFSGAQFTQKYLFAAEAMRIDATSKETAKASVERMLARMTESQRKEFLAAYQRVLFKAVVPDNNLVGAVNASAAMGPDYMAPFIKAAIDGKTADDIIAAAKNL